MNLGQILVAISVVALPMLLAFTVPEIARGRIALALGDRTPAPTGKFSMNPLHYVHPLGTVVLPILTVVAGSPLVFGWAKTVQVDPRNFRRPRLDYALLNAAGPLACLVMAFVWAVLAVRIAPRGWLGSGPPAYWVAYMGSFGISINAFLAVLNLLPVPPFAGGRILMGVLPLKAAAQLARVEPYGFWIVLGLLFLEFSHKIAILGPTVWWVRDLIARIVS
jgi:Zn-dependent protease